MSGTPISPRMLKGAIIGMDKWNPLASVVVFQYNPDTITRRLQARSGRAGGGDAGARSDAQRLGGPPQETISVNIEVDAADQAGGVASAVGVHAPLAALEMLLYPKSAFVIANMATIQAGIINFIAPEAPLTLFVWGPTRVVPVRITEMTITEEAHDNLLNPVRAKVDLSMHVLSYYDLHPTNPGWALFLVHQITKEALAVTNTGWTIANAGTSLKLF
ncbi:hypothetical protein WME98_45265 [Sorangium sp. So ce296]|uniref:hypothetical protein n=1 Tax=unclassified Sorangium TaxID=2621164 RepID=UPI000779734B|nr:hypothetical protein BE20_58780 [Sorangium cellulosum]